MIFKYNLPELLNTAIMTDTPFLLVEGVDDVQVYENIAEKAEKEVTIYIINNIEEYETAGCDNVIKAIDKLQPKLAERADNIRRFLGIIDRDVRPYRGVQVDEIDFTKLYDKGLFILKYYSIETYFATKANLKKLIRKHTSLPSNMINDGLLNLVESEFNNIGEELYFISLEALKNACDTDYNGIVGYSNNSINNEHRRNHFNQQLIVKRNDLDVFAVNLGLNSNDLKLICKGKWFLNNYISRTYAQIQDLSNRCISKEISQCQSCIAGNAKSCQYKHIKGYNISNVYNDILEYVDEVECKDIIERLQLLI
ncbi:MAG: hypothetical protein ACJAUH_000501 [Saprospiraceae bacterium]|jgi:hypothetical protein